MTGVQKSQLSTLSTRTVRSANVNLLLASPNLVLAAPVAGFVRRVRDIIVTNLGSPTPVVQPKTFAGLPYAAASSALSPGASTAFAPVLLNAGEALYVDMDTAIVDGPVVCSLSYEDFPVTAGMGGGITTIAESDLTLLVAAPPAGYKRVFGYVLNGIVPDLENTPWLRFISDPTATLNFAIEFTVGAQIVGQLDLPIGSEQYAFELRVVLLPGETLSTRVLYTPIVYTVFPHATAVDPVPAITAVLYWQDVSL